MTGVGVDELVRDGRLEPVEADLASAAQMLADGRLHLDSAASLIPGDLNGAYALLYDGARKAVTAHMLARGYRARNRPGTHAAVCLYAEAALATGERAGAVRELDRMRRDRNRSEYWIRPFGAAELETDLACARRIVEAVAAAWPVKTD